MEMEVEARPVTSRYGDGSSRIMAGAVWLHGALGKEWGGRGVGGQTGPPPALQPEKPLEDYQPAGGRATREVPVEQDYVGTTSAWELQTATDLIRRINVKGL